MGWLANVRNAAAALIGRTKHYVSDINHGGWVDVAWPLNYWQIGDNLRQQGNNAVNACVMAYAQTIAQLPTYHLRELAEGGNERVRNSNASRVLRKPNSYQTRSDFLLNLIASLMFDGNAYAIVVRNGRGEIVQLHLVNPHKCQPHVYSDGSIFYHVTPDAASGLEPMIVPARDVLHVRLYTPNDPLDGQTPIYAAASSIAANNAILAHHAKFFENMSRPSGVITTDEHLTKEQIEQLREKWEEQSQGLNSGKVPILSWGLKWQSLSLSSADAQLIEALKFSVKDIARAYRVPLALIGEEESATYNNVYNLLMFWKASGLGFVVEHVEQALDNLFRMPDDEGIELDIDMLLKSDMPKRIEALTRGITGGLYSPNEARNKEGLRPVEGGESPRVQQQMVALDWEPPEPAPASIAAPSQPEEDPQDGGEEELSIDDQVIILREKIKAAAA